MSSRGKIGVRAAAGGGRMGLDADDDARYQHAGGRSVDYRAGQQRRAERAGSGFADRRRGGDRSHLRRPGPVQRRDQAVRQGAYDGSTPPLPTGVSNGLGRTLTLAYNGARQLAAVMA